MTPCACTWRRPATVFPGETCICVNGFWLPAVRAFWGRVPLRAPARSGAREDLRGQFLSSARANVEEFMDNKRFELIRHDVTFRSTWRGPDLQSGLPGLACIISTTRCRPSRPACTGHQYARSGQIIGRAHLSGLHQRGSRRPEVHPQTEDYWPCEPQRHPLLLRRGQALRRGSLAYRRQGTFPSKWARIFNTYGPKMHPNDGRVVSNFIIQALKTSPSPFTATAARPVPSAMWTIWWNACCASWPRPTTSPVP